MASEQEFRRTLERARQLVRESNTGKALALLEETLSEVQRDRNDRWTLLFAREAGILSEKQRDLVAAVKYFEIALRTNKTDPYIYFSLGDVLGRLGNRDRSHEYFERCYELARAEGDEDLLSLLQSRGLGF